MDINRSSAIKEGLRRAKNRGVRLGNPDLERVRYEDLSTANRARKENADNFALEISKKVREIFDDRGLTLVGASFRLVVEVLNAEGVKTRRGCCWTVTQFERVYNRILAIKDGQEKA